MRRSRMKIRRRIRARFAAALAAVMAITMTAPALPAYAYALPYGGDAVIRFDPGIGPDLKAKDQQNGQFYWTDGTNDSYGDLPQETEGGKKLSVAHGKAGHALTESTDFGGIATQEAQHPNGGGTVLRPVLPKLRGDGATIPAWPGYRFDGWFDSDGNRLLNLPAHFSYTTPTTYTARWTGDSADQFDFTVMHYRDLNEARNQKKGVDAIIADDTDPEIHAFKKDGPTKVTANQGVSATYRRDIPGYKLQDVLIKNNKKRGFGEASGAGSIEPEAAKLNASNNLTGVMPNDDLTVAYRYEPNDQVKFAFEVEYVDVDGHTIKSSERTAYSAEDEVSKTPDSITAYAFQGAELLEGKEPKKAEHVYAVSDGSLNTSTGEFRGKMPNQKVRIRYTYRLDPEFTSDVVVHYRDNHGELMKNIGTDGSATYHFNFLDEHEVPVPKQSGYTYPPNITFSPNANFVPMQNPKEGYENFKFKLQNGSGSIDVTYLEDLSDTENWARVTYAPGAHGTNTGPVEPKSFPKGPQKLSVLTKNISTDADPNYRFKGWYKADASGKPVGDKLSEDIDLDGDLRLISVFEENEEDWFDLSFVAGSHGSISGKQTAHVPRGTKWSNLMLPIPSPDALYQNDKWYNEAGEPMVDSDALILADQTYTFRFTRFNALPDDHLLAIPDASGGVTSNGSGRVVVSAPNENRKYALTDRYGNIIAVQSGSALQNGAFTGLPVCEQYFVYELEEHQDTWNLDNIQAVDPDKRSQPALAVVPALGNNYSVDSDPLAADKKKLTVTPAAPDTVYALLDADGNIVAQEGAADGWKTPSGSPQTVEFTGLDPNTTYTVVARTASGSETPEEKQPMGSTVTVTGTQSAAESTYVLRLLDGGRVTEITRNGNVIAIGDDETEVTVREGDRIKIDADTADADGNAFRQWNILIGGMTIRHRDRRNQTVTMPRGAVVLQATYNTPPATSAATLDYAPKDGRFALNPEEGAIEALRTALISNPTDEAALSVPSTELAYTVHFDRRSVAASVSNALREKTGGEKLKFPWSVKLGLTRAVNGVNKPLPASGSNAEVNVLARIDESLLGGMDYKLWRQSTDTAGELTFEELSMKPDPNDEDSGFRGVFHFLANIGDTVVLSYSKAYIVTIEDTKRGTVHRLKVRQGESLEDAENYRDIRSALETIWTDPATGIEYELEGIKKSNSASAPIYDVTDEVKRNLTLYALYAPADDSAWQAACEKLKRETDVASALSTNGNVSPEDREDLTQAIAHANAVRTRLPRPTIAELEAEYNALKELVDRITTADPTPPGPTPPGPVPPTPPTPGGSGGHSGGGGGGGGVSRSISATAGPGVRSAYRSGTDGNWDNFDPAKHGWAFVTSAGNRLKDQWADIVYTFGGVSKVYTYHFDADGVMDSGWYRDAAGSWYFLSAVHDGWFGGLIKGWHHDANDGNWYYLNLLDGAMVTGWQKIDGKWYFLNPHTPEQTWFWNAETERWEYRNGQSRPLGAMYAGEQTPDGYRVDESGAWIRETP